MSTFSITVSAREITIEPAGHREVCVTLEINEEEALDLIGKDKAETYFNFTNISNTPLDDILDQFDIADIEEYILRNTR